MRVTLGKLSPMIISTSKVDLPKDSQNYYEIFKKETGGNLIFATFGVNSDDISFLLTIDDEVIMDYTLEDLKYVTDIDDDIKHSFPVYFDNNEKVLVLNFNNPVEFRRSISFKMRSSTSSSKRDLYGYTILFANEEKE